MPRYRHPRVDADDPARFAVQLGDEQVVLDSDGCFESEDDRAVERLADAYGTTPEDMRVDDGETCEVVKADGDVCGRELPCPYHSED